MAAQQKKQGTRSGKQRPDDRNPRERRVTKRQAAFLSERTGIAASELAELELGTLHERLQWHLDPTLLFFRRVCGRVVRPDPETGELHPVPFATVHVEDTDCNLLFHAPEGFPYFWIYPGLCTREEIATVETDACGNFCVWIPRWEIDRILRWRRERIYFPEIDIPRLVDILEDLFPVPRRPPPRPPFPLPDPLPDFTDVEVRREVERRLGAPMAERLARLAPDRTFGAFRGALDAALREPAPREALPRPPLPSPDELPAPHRKHRCLKEIDPRRPVGPFRLCKDVIVPEWTVALDIPDITFRVTQTQGDQEVTIYAEGFFDVRWNETEIPDVILEAGPNAQAVEICEEDPGIVCEDEPAILNISEMPLTEAYHDNTGGDDRFGYGIRVNGPSSDGLTPPPLGAEADAGKAHAPYADRLNLYGCYHIGDNTHYRVVAAFEGGTPEPITGVTFPVLTTTFTIDHQIPDPAGWYPIRNDLIGSYEHLILPWPTQQSRFADGRYEIRLQVGTGTPGSITSQEESDPFTFEVDNARPNATFHQIRWWHDAPGEGPDSAVILEDPCPVLHRQSGVDVIVEVRWSASAAHPRSAAAGFGGCGGGNPVALGAASDRAWWWQDPSDTTTGLKVARWRIPGSLPPGCYTASLSAVSRAYNPAVPGADTTHDWYVLEGRRRVHPSKAISVVDV